MGGLYEKIRQEAHRPCNRCDGPEHSHCTCEKQRPRNPVQVTRSASDRLEPEPRASNTPNSAGSAEVSLEMGHHPISSLD